MPTKQWMNNRTTLNGTPRAYRKSCRPLLMKTNSYYTADLMAAIEKTKVEQQQECESSVPPNMAPWSRMLTVIYALRP